MQPVEVLVRSFGRPDVIVMASSQTEARVKAAIEWGCSFLDVCSSSRLYVRKSAMEGRERTSAACPYGEKGEQNNDNA
jgi:hypothetical protein